MSEAGSEENEVVEEVEVEKYFYWTTEQVIQPNNERTQELAQKRLKDLRDRQKKEQEQLRLQLEIKKKNQEEEDAHKKLKQMLEEKRKQDEIRIQEEMQLLQDLKGNFASMITNIYNLYILITYTF